MSNTSPTFDAALEFTINYLQRGMGKSDTSYGYDLYVNNVVRAYVRGERSRQSIYPDEGIVEASPPFFDAAWELCRMGVLRPSVKMVSLQSVPEGGYSLTQLGIEKLSDLSQQIISLNPVRVAGLLRDIGDKFGAAYAQRVDEAIRCYRSGCYYATCAMVGAAAEAILLALAVEANGDESAVMSTYHSASGRRRVMDGLIGKLSKNLADPIRSSSSILSYWRDNAAHGVRLDIGEVESHEALVHLLRFSQFAHDKWSEVTSK